MKKAPRRVFLVDDDDLLRWNLEQELPPLGFEVRGFGMGEEALTALQVDRPDVMLLDVRLPGIDGLQVLDRMRAGGDDLTVLVISGLSDIGLAVEAMRRGAQDFITKPYVLDDVAIRIERAIERDAMEAEVRAHRQARLPKDALQSVVAKDPLMRRVADTLIKFASSDAPVVLLTGEGGTGKGVLAALFHRLSGRRDGPFQELNCAILPEAILERDIFGQERGASDPAAAQARGLIELADRGTIFLDEIGGLPQSVQARLLDYLETRRFRRVGGVHELTADARIVAATNRDLAQAVKDGTFRGDLFYRLRDCAVDVPPLRQRRQDIPELATQFFHEANRRLAKGKTGFSSEALTALERYDWPGNVRELRGVVERVVLLGPGRVVELRDLPPEIAGGSLSCGQGPVVFAGEYPEEGIALEEVERVVIQLALDKAQGNQSKAAKLLRISRDVLRYRMQKFGFLPKREE